MINNNTSTTMLELGGTLPATPILPKAKLAGITITLVPDFFMHNLSQKKLNSIFEYLGLKNNNNKIFT